MQRKIFLERIEEERRRYLKRRTSAFFIALLLVASLNSRGLYVELKPGVITGGRMWQRPLVTETGVTTLDFREKLSTFSVRKKRTQL